MAAGDSLVARDTSMVPFGFVLLVPDIDPSVLDGHLSFSTVG